MQRYDRFFSMWALMAHCLCLCNLIPSTYSLALFVAFGSLILRYGVAKEPMSFMNHLLLHFGPLFVISKPSKMNWNVLFLTMFLYLTYHCFDVCTLFHYYEYSTKALHGEI
mgnify:FL=1